MASPGRTAPKSTMLFVVDPGRDGHRSGNLPCRRASSDRRERELGHVQPFHRHSAAPPGPRRRPGPACNVSAAACDVQQYKRAPCNTSADAARTMRRIACPFQVVAFDAAEQRGKPYTVAFADGTQHHCTADLHFPGRKVVACGSAHLLRIASIVISATPL